jgi:hypothetical protein
MRSVGRLVVISFCILVGSEVARIAGIIDHSTLRPNFVGSLARTTSNTTGRHASPILESTEASRHDSVESDALFSSVLELVQPRPSNLSIVFVGDSVSRYQYLSLAYFLKHGRWPDPREYPTVVYCHSYHHPRLQELDWAEFFFQTNRRLHPHEICDCQRYANFQLERRYFYDPDRNNTVVYINLNGNEPTDTKLPGYYFGSFDPVQILSNFSLMLESSAPPRRVFRQKRMVAWQYPSWQDVLRHHVGALNMPGLKGPTVFLNAGLHPHNLRPGDFGNLTIDSEPRMRVVWKTTTYSRRVVADTTDTTESERDARNVMDDNDRRFCRDMDCLDVSWTHRVGRRFFFDQIHYREPVYRILNEQVMEYVHALPPGYVRLPRSRVLSPAPPPVPANTSSVGSSLGVRR